MAKTACFENCQRSRSKNFHRQKTQRSPQVAGNSRDLDGQILSEWVADIAPDTDARGPTGMLKDQGCGGDESHAQRPF